MPSTLTRRVELLEEKMEAFVELPARMAGVEQRMTRVEADLGSLRVEMREGFDRLREEIRAGDEDTRRQMRILHEEVMARFAILHEGIDRINGNSKRSRSPNRKK